MPPMSFKKVYLWHLSGDKWDKVMERYELVSKSLRAIHQRFLDRAKNKHRYTKGGRGNSQLN